MSTRKKYLSLEEIEQIIEQWSDNSEDEFADSDDENFEQEESETEDVDNNNRLDIENLNIENIPVVFANDIEMEGLYVFEATSDETFNETNGGKENDVLNKEVELKELRERFKKLIWKNVPQAYDQNSTQFKGDDSLPPALLELDTPLSVFNIFFDDEMLEMILRESNLYGAGKNIANPYTLTKMELRKFLGVCILSSVHQLSNSREYWCSDVGNRIIQDAMSLKTFVKIKNMLHFADNNLMLPKDNLNHDRLFKIRPFINILQKKFAQLPLEQKLSVDEQICSTKIRSHMKQYVPSKPHKWGFKIFALTGGTSGYMYNFEIYTGQENMYRQMQEENLGASANVIVRLCRIIPRFLNHTVFCDNYFTTVPLILYLQNEGIHCIGTIRRNRIPNPKLKTEREMQKCARGFYEEFSTSFENVAMSLVHWRDKKYVTLISSYCGALPTSTVKRWDNKNKKSIIIQRPAIIKEYNRHMGGVDLHDSFIGRYRIKLKSSKWYLRMFFHFLDVAVVNSWIIYRQLCASRKIASMSLNQFRKDVAKGLCLVGSYVKPSTSSSSKRLNQALMKKTRKKSAQNIPIKDIRVDKVGHFPIWDKRTRCKLPSCKEQSFIKCTKCQVSLCLNSSRNCFLEFHQ